MSFPIEILAAVLPMAAVAGAFAFGVELLKIKLEKRIRERRGETPSERIEKLSKALTDATSLISGIERELNERHRLVEKLREDCDRYDHLAKLKASEVEAVVRSLRGELRQEGKRSFWQSVGLNFVFFVAGVLVTVYMA